MSVFTKWIDDIEFYWDWQIFVAQLVGFLIIIFVLGKYAWPPVKRMMKARQEEVEAQVAAAQEAKVAATAGAEELASTTAAAKAEAQVIEADAVEDAKAIRADIAEQTEAELARIEAQRASTIERERTLMLRGLSSELGADVYRRAEEIVRANLADDAGVSASVDRVIEEISAMAGGDEPSSVATTADLVGIHSLQPTSRVSAREVSETFNRLAADLSAADQAKVGDELFAVLDLLAANPVLRQRLVEFSDNSDGKAELFERLLGGKISPATLEVVKAAAVNRWSSTSDVRVAITRQAQAAVLSAAETDGVIDQVENELFHAARLLESNPELSLILSDDKRPAAGRADLFAGLVRGKVSDYTEQLVRGTIAELGRGFAADTAVDRLAELAAARRGETVAEVTSATGLSDAQRDRVAAALTEVYRRPVKVQVHIDPAILGGLKIKVGDEAIDADVASTLARAAIANQ